MPEIPIVTFPSVGFSQQGKTLLEYATSLNIFSFAMECGEKGFSSEMATAVGKIIHKIMDKLSVNLSSEPVHEKIPVHHLCHFIPNTGNSHLIPGLKSYMEIKKGQILGYEGKDPILSPLDGRIFFPKLAHWRAPVQSSAI